MELVLCSHEGEASYVATGYSKASRELVAILTTGSPGVTNGMSGIASANKDSVPLLHISGRTPESISGYGVQHEENTIDRSFESDELLASLTKYSVKVTDINMAAEQFIKCCNIALSGRYGSVHISIPVDIQSAQLPYVPQNYYHEKCHVESYKPPMMTKPLLIIGWGCWQAECVEQVYELAKKVKAPVLVTSKAYCCAWSANDYYLGKLGYGYNAHIEEFLLEYRAEQVLIFGSSMGLKDFSHGFRELLEQAECYLYSVDFEDVMHRFPKGTWIKIKDMGRMLGEWLDEISSMTLEIDLIERIKDNRETQKKYFNNKIAKTDIMAQAINKLNDICDDTCVVTADAGNHLLNVAALYEPPKIGSLYFDVGIRAMGNGICATVGMAMFNKQKYYIAVTGDGCMLMNGNVMYLAKKHNLPILFLVFNNHSLGRVRVGQMAMKGFVESGLGGVDFMLYGKAMGLETYRVYTVEEYEKVLEEILLRKETALLEFMCDQDEIPVLLK